MFLLIILYLVLTSVNIYSLKKSFVDHNWSIYNYAYCYLILFYNIAPLLIYIFKFLEINYDTVYLEPKFAFYLEIDLFIFLLISIFFVIYNFSFNEFVKRRKFKLSYSKFFNEKSIAFLFLIISAFSIFFYIKGFGSFSNAISNADLIRSGNFIENNTNQDTGHTIFQRFINLAIIPFLYFFYNKTSKVKLIIPFVISFIILFISYVFLSGSRQSIIDIFLLFIIADLIKKNKFINFKLVFLFFLAIYILPLLDSVFKSLSYSDTLEVKTKEIDLFSVLINEFGFPFYSLYYAVIENYNFNYFSDFYLDLFGSFFPSSWGPNLKTSNYLNSFYTQGLLDKGYVPPGLLAQGYYSLGILGVLLISFFTSYVFKILDSFFKNILINNIGFVFFYSFFIVKSLAWVRTGLPGNYFYNTVLFFSFIFIVFFLNKKNKI